MPQWTVPCSVYRGGTSRGLFFHEKDLPKSDLKNRIFFSGIDAYNPSQINGLGSGTSHTSKVIVVSNPSVKGVDIDYTFYQIGIAEEIVDAEGTCGNLMAAVGAFAVDEGLAGAREKDGQVTVRAYNRNIGKIIRIKVPVEEGQAKVTGDFLMPGVVTKGAKITVDILSPGGGKTGKTLPAGRKTEIEVHGKNYEVSFVDIVNPFVYVSADVFGLRGSESNHEAAQRIDLLSELEEIRVHAAIAAGMAKTIDEARNIPSIPKIALIGKPHMYATTSGITIYKDEVDIVAKMVSMNRFHRTFAGSGLYNLAASVLLHGTIPNQHAFKENGRFEQKIRIGHPEGIAEVRVQLTGDGTDVTFVGLERTARRIMKGALFIPPDVQMKVDFPEK
ncbi:PrpF domain-containing protein [Siminovitchia sp. 179-K 8D1 HS]|uniref:PrpF domain-containing protein n=1 Tax=Siminovitchia sp. 179-K 8D1 HS TaxID=3142385 RepID=UPI0039A0006A